MTMPVFALLTPVVVPPPLTQSQPALMDYSDSQQQSYSDDLATLLAGMEAALTELDTELQQLPEATDATGPALVQSMLPQPLLFALVPETEMAAQPTEPAMPATAGDSAELLTKASEQPALPIAVLPLPPERKTAATTQRQLPPQQSSTELPASGAWPVSRHVADLRLQNTSSLMSALNPNLTSQFNSLAPVNPQLLNTELFTPVAATTAGHLAATASLPVWQADPMPAQSQHWGQRLVQMLADKVDLQLGLNVNKALIRLDPPSLGSIELSVQLDGDRLTVQMHSSNAQLREAMGQGLEQLRASLQQKLGSDVQIELRMGTESSSQQQQQQAQPQLTQQAEANFYAEPDAEQPTASRASAQNLMNQLV
ncbi:flagellar hook-length control protein FliK [Rheinheimera soli]|uniref:Flagellar hook-length control protein FliK n=1 Tax=Rheinheimera soli TaxID=443616 RepID=A0ABU1VZT9_9GAMM|nr:flagellar hook-length control protein FliK [Rheinheimera soli]MDR7121110.1 flagellar hook-length control protein FliK [Rheinheimera soli]